MAVGKVDQIQFHLVLGFKQYVAHAAALLRGLQHVVGGLLVLQFHLEITILVQTHRVDRLELVFNNLADDNL